MNRYILLLATIVVTLFAIGCSSGGGMDITQPEGASPVQASISSHQLWGLFQFTANTDAETLDIIPLRIADMHLNALPFLEPPPLLYISLESLAFNGNIIDADIGIRHPFLGLMEFTGFDVCGVLITNGSVTGFSNPDLRAAGDGDTRLLNPDGCSRWWNPAEFPHDGTMFGYKDGLLGTPDSIADFNCTINGYKYFCDDLDDPDAPLDGITLEKRGMFGAGMKCVRHYSIELGAEGLVFNYAVDANWEFPNGSFPWTAPDDFGPGANRPEAYRLSIKELENSLFYVNDSMRGGNLSLLIDVYDWSDPGMNTVTMECPSVIPMVADSSPLGGGDGYSTYQLDFAGATPDDSGLIDVLISIVDPTMDYQGFLPGENITAYFIHRAIVSDVGPVQATVLDIDPDWGWVDEAYEDVTITGADFWNGCEVKLAYTPGDVIDGTNVTWIDENTLEADFDLAGATIGLYDVQVINPGVPAGVLEDGFEVKEMSIIWPVSQGDVGHTGYVGLNGPSGVLSGPNWTGDYTPVGGNGLSVFLSDDTAFYSFTGHTLYALPAVATNLSDGSTKWEKTLHNNAGDWTNVKGISDNGTVVLVFESSTGTFAGLDDGNDGAVLWQLSGGMYADTYITNDLNGNFILPMSSGYRSVVPQTGTVNWTANIGNAYYCAPGVGPDGTIYCYVNGLSNAQLHALDPDTGADNWSSYPSFGHSTNGVTVSPDGKIIVFSSNGLYCFTDNGSSASQLWHQSYAEIWYGSASVAPNGDIYVFDNSGTLRRLDPDNGITISSSGGWTAYGTRPAIGDDGLIYTNNGYYFRCFNPDCSLRWQYYGQFSSYFCAPAIGQDGWVYAAKRQEGLYAWHD